MTDRDLIALYESRNEQAIAVTKSQFGSLCTSIANKILHDTMDAEECVSDALLQTWNAIPPERPKNFAAYLSTVTRNAALTRFRKENREKRGGGTVPLILDELSECIRDNENVESEYDRRALRESIQQFLDTLSADARTVFVRRYISMYDIKDIAEEYEMNESKVKVSLMRTREKLRKYLKKEGFL